MADYYLLKGQADSCRYYLLKSLEANSESLKDPVWSIFSDPNSLILEIDFLSEPPLFHTLEILLNLAKKTYAKENNKEDLNRYDQYIQLASMLSEKLRKDRSSDLDKLRILK